MRAIKGFSVVCLLVMVCLLVPGAVHAQCYISQGCAPVDNLTYGLNGNGQVYHGDGASNNGVNGWSIAYSDVNQCLGCHYGSDTLSYLMTGHKNTLRKEVSGVLWGGPDGVLYPASDSHYGSGSVFNWSGAQVTVGWCSPVSTPAQNGLPVNDASCLYPFYTLPNANAPAPYPPVAPTQAAGGVRNLYYMYGGWQNYGGVNSPGATQLNTVFDSGFTGDLYPNGNFDCARCHATGYNFDRSAPEPTSNWGQKVTWISDAHLKRIPSDGYQAPGTTGTSSWYLTGIQCERCHVAATAQGSHPYYYYIKPTIPRNEAATMLCVECHRAETITPENPPLLGSITPATILTAKDRGYCSDLSGAAYAACVATTGNQWIYKPYLDHEAGLSFLNSPHGRLNGSLVQNEQHSADLSVSIAGSYGSQFSEAPSDSSKNLGCAACHDPHQTTVAGVSGAKPIVQGCDSCHSLAKTIMNTINHPMGPGTPFPTGLQSDVPGACVTCHMQAALGRANSHLLRINPDVNYSTFPTPDQMYKQGNSAIGTAPSYSALSGQVYTLAAWLDVDLACGQCHVGNDGKTNEYGLVPPPGLPGAHAFTKSQLAYWASVMHPGDPGVPNPMFSPGPGTYSTPQTITISDALSTATIYYTTDGSLPTPASPVYSTPISIAKSTTIYAVAYAPGIPASSVALAQYTINLPTAPAPLFSPGQGTFNGSVSVKLSNTANLPMYYTIDGSTPTTSSIPYAGPITVSSTTTINAMSASYGYITGPVSTATYQIQAPTPTIAPPSGTYHTTQTVTITDSAATATIYYTTNGAAPTTSSTPCSNPCSISVSASSTVKAIAAGGGYVTSNTAVATYVIVASTPVFSPNPGTYYAPQTVTITDATAGATIYYSTTGAPTTSSPSCSSPCTVTISTTSTLRAMAVGAGITQSGIVAGVYTIAASTPNFSPAPGFYSTPQTVTISESTPGATIYYTTDGSFPTTSSASCTVSCSVLISTNTTIRAMAVGAGISQSPYATGIYRITGH